MSGDSTDSITLDVISSVDEQQDGIDLTMIEQNEKYFISIFKSLSQTKKPDVLCKLLQVIQFYSENFQESDQIINSPAWKRRYGWREIIDPTTIIWLLKLIKNSIKDKYLSCLSSLTLLQLVERHSFTISYNESAIVKGFNKSLVKMELFDALGDAHTAARLAPRVHGQRHHRRAAGRPHPGGALHDD